MSRAIIIGYGNPSRRDDGVGHYIVQKVKDASDGQVEALILHQLGIELVETLKDWNLVIFADSYVGDRVEELEVASLEAAYTPSALTHFITPNSLLALTESLYQKSPEAFLVSVKGYDFDFGTELSPKTLEWANIAVEKILEIISTSV